MTAKAPTVLLMAGGTGGHIFPAQALAEELAGRGWHIHWLGTADRMEATLVPKLGWPFHSIVVRGLRGKSIRQLLTAPWMLLNAIRQARQLLKRLQPDLVVGFGGYASGPGGIAAWLQRTPLLIHEQNAVAGTTNRWLARLANKVLVAFPQAFAGHAKQQVVGNPVRKALIAAQEPVHSASQNQPAALRVLVIGGSLGAKALNDALPQQLAELSSTTPMQVRHQTGSAMQAEVQHHYQQLHSPSFDGQAHAFIDDMAAAYQWADLVICRAGALTVSEVACAGMAAVFVPLPQAIDDHQTANANWLVGQQAALLLPQPQLQQGGLVALLAPLLDNRTQLQQLAAKARQCALDDAAQQLADACEQQLGARV